MSGKTDESPSEARAVVAIIPLRRGRELRASISTYGDERFVSLRTFWQPSESTTWVASSGITLASAWMPELEEAVRALRQAIDAPNADPEKGG